MDARSNMLSQGRWRWYEPFLWVAAFALPALLPGHALIVNEIAIVAGASNSKAMNRNRVQKVE